jgi:alkane 1-monooxygenase
MQVRWLKYAVPFTVYPLALLCFTQTGWLCWLTLVYAWVLVPLTELLIPPDARNMDAAEEEMARRDRRYDMLLYAIVPLQWFSLGLFLFSLRDAGLSTADTAARVWTMGLLCGTFGINVGHELGHRIKPYEQWLAKALLASSLYMHFFIEHNKGHHKRVATPEDPSSARYNEMVYTFYLRTIIFSYLSAWHIANDECRKKGRSIFSLHNEMIQAHLVQAAIVAVIFSVFGWLTGLYFLAAALIGILLLETVNYIEHYGLERKKLENGRYERALPQHSWNSSHVLGRLLLFELSRHSDHHFLASRKYQVLRHHDNAPQLPTGYPGSMLLALAPPAWFYVMNRRIKKLQEEEAVAMPPSAAAQATPA